MNNTNNINYYEIEAEEVDIFGNLREVSLSENILKYTPFSTKSLIDIGCGDGYIIYRTLNSKKHSIINTFGLDIANKRLAKTRKFVPNGILVQGSILHLPFKNNSFDTVICSETLEHIKEYKKALLELIRISRKNLLVTVPNEENLTIEKCPKCNHHFYLNDHVNSFSSIDFVKQIKELISSVKIKKIHEFHTVFSYNRSTLKWPSAFRMMLDKIIVMLSKQLPFFKPNYLLLSIKKVK